MWGARIDDVSNRLLTDALQTAAGEGQSVRLHAFAAAARDLFRHAAQMLAQRHKCRWVHGSTVGPCRDAHSDGAVAQVKPLHGELLAAIDDLRDGARLQPRVTCTKGTEAHRSLQEALSAMRELSDAIGVYLERVLQPLTPRIGRHAIHAFIRENRHKVNELAACCTDGQAYAEDLTITESDDSSVSIEIEGALGAPGQ